MDSEDPLRLELQRFAAAGRRTWRIGLPDVAPFLDLPQVRAQTIILGFVDHETVDARLDAFDAAVEAAILSLADPFRTATQHLFGFLDTAQLPIRKGKREEHAAKALGYTDRWLRGPVRRPPFNGRAPLDFLIEQVELKLTASDPESALAATAAPDLAVAGAAPGAVVPAVGPVGAVSTLTSHELIRRLYQEVTPDDLERGFWWRSSTDRYLAQLSALPQLTIFGGADGPADIGPPLHAEVISVLLRNCLETHPLITQYAKGRDFAELADELIEAVTPYASSSLWIGSMVTGLYRTRPGFTSDTTAVHLQRAMAEVSGRTTTIGFVSRAITEVAFALAAKGTRVAVISDHYDSDLEKMADGVPGNDAGYAYAAYDEMSLSEAGRLEVPLIRLHRPARPLIGEAEYVTGQGGAQVTFDTQASRFGLLRAALSSGPVLFVGSSIMDPGLVSALAATIECEHTRYALLLAPKGMGVPSLPFETLASRSADAKNRRLLDGSLQLALLAARYLHLGVVPIYPDFPSQVPQFLRELAIKVRSDAARPYENYDTRITKWWDQWATRLGFGTRGAIDQTESDRTQKEAYETLRELRETLSEELLSSGAGERLMIEAWIRHPSERYLFRWATSESIWMRGETATRASLREDGDLTQEVFREGRMIWRPLEQTDWRYCIGMNLVLQNEPWHHLPIGVIKVLSNLESGELYSLANSERRTRLEVVQMRLRRVFGDSD